MAETKKPLPNQKLRYERERRGWSQQEVADQVGTTPLNVGRWERGLTVPGPHFRVKLSEVFGKSPSELGLVVERPPVPLSAGPSPVPDRTTVVAETHTPLWNVPYRRNSFFTGREEVLDQLRAALSERARPIAISQAQAISGLGGIGKTQLAVEYAYRYRDDYSAVFWARAESIDLLVSDYLTIAALLKLPERNVQEQHTIVNAVLRWFDTHEGWLLILDNADQLEVTRAFIPSTSNGQVLLTTRAFSTGTVAGRIELETMTTEEGILFLLRRIKRIGGNTPLESVPESVRSQARAIVEAMDALPLALDQAGAYIEETRSSLSDYLKLYRARRQRLLRKRGQDAVGHPEPVATTWSLAFEKIKQANPAAAELLRLLALLHPDRIPESMIVEGAAALGPVLEPVVRDEIDFNEAIGELHKYSLIKRDPEERILAIHRLVQAVIWDGMTEQEREQWTERTVAALDAIFPDIRYEFTQEFWGQRERLLPHVLTCAAAIAPQQHNLAFASVLYKAAEHLRERAQYEQAGPLYQRALQMREQALGPEHPDVATSLHGLAIFYREQNKYAQAEPLFLRALQMREQALGAEHPEVATSLHGLAFLYHDQGKYEQAEPLYQRALQIWEQALGPEHPQVAYPLTGLALLYRDRGEYEQAELLFLRALQTWEQALGPAHPRVAWPLNDLANLYSDQGKYEQAELLFLRALQIWEQALGPEHSDVATPLNNLAELYYLQGKYEQAEPLYQRALQIWEQVLGPAHSAVAHPLNGLALLSREQGKYEQAEPLFLRALQITEQAMGLEHPDVAHPLQNLADLYQRQGKYEQAEPLYQRVLRIREQALGPVHPQVAWPLNGLASLYLERGKYEQAEPLFLRALRIREQYLGLQHPETAESLHDFARFYEMRKRPEEALALYLRALAIREQQLGSQHPRTVDTRTRAAQLLRESGRAEEGAAYNNLN